MEGLRRVSVAAGSRVRLFNLFLGQVKGRGWLAASERLRRVSVGASARAGVFNLFSDFAYSGEFAQEK